MNQHEAAPLASTRVAAWRIRHLLGIMLICCTVFVALAIVAGESDPNAIDLSATRWLQQAAPSWFGVLMFWVSWFGYSPQNIVMPVVVAAAVFVRSLHWEAVWVLGTQLSAILTVVIKELVHRPRPAPDLVGVSVALQDPSFPSGHTVQYTTLFGFVFFLVYVLAQPSVWRTALLILLAFPIVTVGVSRPYLGQHWLSDVLGGYALALLLLTAYCWAYARRLERRSASG